MREYSIWRRLWRKARPWERSHSFTIGTLFLVRLKLKWRERFGAICPLPLQPIQHGDLHRWRRAHVVQPGLSRLHFGRKPIGTPREREDALHDGRRALTEQHNIVDRGVSPLTAPGA